jgi:hypothetical protein
MGSIERLIAAGFKEIGHWQLHPELGLQFVGHFPAEAGVYTIVVNGQVRYVGCALGGPFVLRDKSCRSLAG